MGARKLLIIEDDQAILQLYTSILKGSFDVDTASDGSKGLTKAKVGGYDLILLDIMLPELDGLGVLAALKKTPPQHPNGPIVMLTNLSGDPIIKQARDLGAQDCFTKVEMNPDQLVNKIQAILK